MSLKRVCDFCGADYDGRINKYHDTRPGGVDDIKQDNKEMDWESEYRPPSLHNSYTLRIHFTMLSSPSIELDVCPICCYKRLIAYAGKLSKQTVMTTN